MSTINKIEMDGVEYGLEASAFDGILPIKNGGTGQSSQSAARTSLGLGNVNNTQDQNKSVAASSKLTTQRNLLVDLSSSTARPFDGSQDVDDIGTKGTLPISRGGTGATSASQARTALGIPSSIGGQNTQGRGQTGWWKCGSTGLIIQWGSVNIGPDRDAGVTFPIAFPNAGLTGQATHQSAFSVLGDAGAGIRNITKTTAIVRNGDGANRTLQWLVIGY